MVADTGLVGNWSMFLNLVEAQQVELVVDPGIFAIS